MPSEIVQGVYIKQKKVHKTSKMMEGIVLQRVFLSLPAHGCQLSVQVAFEKPSSLMLQTLYMATCKRKFIVLNVKTLKPLLHV